MLHPCPEKPKKKTWENRANSCLFPLPECGCSGGKNSNSKPNPLGFFYFSFPFSRTLRINPGKSWKSNSRDETLPVHIHWGLGFFFVLILNWSSSLGKRSQKLELPGSAACPWITPKFPWDGEAPAAFPESLGANPKKPNPKEASDPREIQRGKSQFYPQGIPMETTKSGVPGKGGVGNFGMRGKVGKFPQIPAMGGDSNIPKEGRETQRGKKSRGGKGRETRTDPPPPKFPNFLPKKIPVSQKNPGGRRSPRNWGGGGATFPQMSFQGFQGAPRNPRGRLGGGRATRNRC